ncbi:MAG TPA: DUF3662 domain-containing protein [Aggregatilinea sp.]|uniref:FhaA domain-containing protein n=1 Tax=Aggregatilinea sp. TaxID=2806333 RepID=UPI002C1831B8|nr:FhaA domain-containing protein [Aggregatilinea sp.]HML23042.1 DUF3662 domain-containing protein [Aggregatilinea sp.]
MPGCLTGSSSRARSRCVWPVDDQQRDCAPNHFAVHLHPADHTALLAREPELAALLSEHLVALAHESGLWLDSLPGVELIADGAVPAHTVSVVTSYRRALRESTQVLHPLGQPEDASPRRDVLPDAFLIVDGKHYVPLDRPVINIGRRRDNTIVLDDMRISRHHCQLRFRFGEFVLYDLGSRGGTFVNNQRVSECVLRPGDVLSLAGVPLVYHVDEASTGRLSPKGDTQVWVRPVEDDAASANRSGDEPEEDGFLEP